MKKLNKSILTLLAAAFLALGAVTLTSCANDSSDSTENYDTSDLKVYALSDSAVQGKTFLNYGDNNKYKIVNGIAKKLDNNGSVTSITFNMDGAVIISYKNKFYIAFKATRSAGSGLYSTYKDGTSTITLNSNKTITSEGVTISFTLDGIVLTYKYSGITYTMYYNGIDALYDVFCEEVSE